MKNTLLVAILLFAQPLCAESKDPHPTMSCNKDTVVVFDDTQSPDRRFALGWTIRHLTKDAKPVDWARFGKEGAASLDDFVFKDHDTSGKKPTHQFIDGVIDLRNKSFKPIPDTDPIGPYHNHRDIKVKWVDEKHALILVDRRWHTEDALFVRPASAPLEVTCLLPQMAEQVGKLIREKRPLAPKMYVAYGFREYVTTEEPSDGMGMVSCKVKNGVLNAHFSACIPKGSFEDIDGHILISLQNGKPLKAISDSPADQPFVGALGEADKRLNEIYGKLRKSLASDELNRLVSNQLEWLSTRNAEAYGVASEKVPYFDEGDPALEAYREARNQEALKLTLERTVVLQKQFEAASSR